MIQRTLLAVFLVCLALTSASAQQAGQINGVVSDTSGGAVPGVTITATEVTTNFQQTTVTGSDGRYQFPCTQAYGLRDPGRTGWLQNYASKRS